MKRKAVLLFEGQKNTARYADNLCVCSAECCGNPRKHFKQKTLKEKITRENFERENDETEFDY